MTREWGAVRRVWRFASRSGVERQLLIQSFLLLWILMVALHLFPLVSVRRTLSGLARRATGVSHEDGPRPDMVFSAVTVASRYVPWATCLVRALASEALLERHGWPSRLHVGVKRDTDGTLAAHAWIQGPDGAVVGGECASYVPLPLFDGARPNDQ